MAGQLTGHIEKAGVEVRLQIKTPILPNFLEVTGVHHASMDEAIGHGALRVPVAMLNDAAVEQFVQQWAADFRAHVARKRVENAAP